MSRDISLQIARREICYAVMFLPPYEIEKLFKELAEATEGLGHKLTQKIEDLIL